MNERSQSVESPGPQTVNKSWELNPPSVIGRGLETIMGHNLQVLFAIGISVALCVVTWIWARRCTTSVFHGKDN
jgi:hypothetical protein